MALPAAAVFQIQSTAAASNINAGGFNPANASMLTDGAATSATGNSAVFSSASYNFVAGDVGHWLYIKSGTNWTPGWYQIASVAANAATLSSAIGQGIQVGTNNRYGTQTIAGVATVASPTAGTWTVDYSQSNAAAFAPTDLVLATTTTLTSVAFPFGRNMVGNLIHITGGTGFTVGWYEIVSVATVTATIDRVGGTLASTGGIGNTGGALSLGSSDDAVFELAVGSTTASTRYFVKGGTNITYTIGGSVSITATGNNSWPVIVEGYATTRGDRPQGATRPTFALGANTFNWGGNWHQWCINGTGVGVDVFIYQNQLDNVFYSKCVNSSATGGRSCFDNSGGTFVSCEAISYRGTGFILGAQSVMIGCTAHDSATGISGASAQHIRDCLIYSCTTAAITMGGATLAYSFFNNTLYGAENKLGTGLNLGGTSRGITFMNNILYGFVTGVTFATTTNINWDDYNNYFNNTTDIGTAAAWQKGPNDIALNPSFTSVTQRTGSTAITTATNHLVQTGALFQTWGITPGVDYIYIKSGTGVVAGVYGILSVDSETQITTDIALAADATANKVWQITQGNNFNVGTNMKATGYPGVFPGAQTTGYLDIGAVQRQESTGGSGGSFTFS